MIIKMKKGKARFSWAIFGLSLTALLTIGGILISNIDVSLIELVKSIAILIFASLLLSVIFGYWRPIWNASSNRIWMHFAKVVSRKYIEKRINEYGSKIRILGLKNNDGTVNLILEASFNDGIFPGDVLDVITEPGEERYGEVQVIQFNTDGCIVSPTNRINTTFWEKLEDRMKSDPSAPLNVVARLQIPEGVIEFLTTLLYKEEKHAH
jgi:hypothetical protein